MSIVKFTNGKFPVLNINGTKVYLKKVNPSVTIGGHKYPVVKIGNLLWMAENLHEEVGSYKILGNAISEPKYGYIYQKQTIAKSVTELTNEMSSIIDDTGWRMPSLSDWESALSQTGGYTTASNIASKSAIGWLNDDNGDNSNGLNIYPCGLWTSSKQKLEYSGTRAYIWCANGSFISGGFSTRITFAGNSTAVYTNSNSYNYDNCGVRLVKDVT